MQNTKDEIKSMIEEVGKKEYFDVRRRRGMEEILRRLPDDIGRSIRGLPDRVMNGLEEIRFRVNRPVTVLSSGREYEVGRRGADTVSHEEIEKIFSLLVHHSSYAYQEQIKNGYITLDGGHRVGICGRTVCDDGRVVSIRDISSLNIRRGCEYPGISDSIMPYLFDGSGRVRSTIIVSPPKCGKTTVLRDLARNMSSSGQRVGLCDERSEIAGCSGGIPGFDVGARTDIMDGCPKDIGITMLIRSMSPDVIVVDEIGSQSDAAAVERAAVAGTALIASMHGASFDDAVRSPLGKFIKSGIISRIVLLTSGPSPGTVADIFNSAGMSLLAEPEMVWSSD